MDYPKRESHYAHKLTRLLFKSCAAQSMGPHAICLIIHVAHTEDASRYQGPVRFWNSQLMEVLGLTSPKQLNNARQAAVDAGWLVYGRTNDRSVGHYWTSIPESVASFDTPPFEAMHSAYGTQSGTQSGTRNGTHCGTQSGKPSNPIPNPKKVSALRADASDVELARWMFDRVRRIAPKAREPDFTKWGNTIRLMRERDGHSLAEIKEVFQWANEHTQFWAVNVMCPEKLREKFARLHAESQTGNHFIPLVSKQPKRRAKVISA
ncbi:hypothetical protein [Rhodopirellula sp. SWK7]|uniref:hypothetical protein n=1 Tax=Rhodopirellula sp. SWK7 TaxID=595460 RepID=UPI0002BFD6D6|nr:hypothetical protein [Rhodopirellula sp. SWK7]EMI44518.1 phage replication protein O [Rhodopirellula sp. SWK7]